MEGQSSSTASSPVLLNKPSFNRTFNTNKMTNNTIVQPTSMDIDRDEAPSTKHDTSDSLFIDEYENSPAGGPINHVQIIDLKEHSTHIPERTFLQLQNVVINTLGKVSPHTLKSFLSPTVHTFKAVFGRRDVQLVIWRKGLEVFIGTFENHSSLKVYGFKHVAGVLIGYDGSWHLKVTAENAFSNPKWNEIWVGRFESYGGVAKMSVEVEDAGMAKQASRLAESILENKFWELKADVKAT